MSPVDIGVLVLTIDGIQQSRGGVGRYVRNLTRDLPRFQAEFRSRDISMTFHFAEPLLSSADAHFDADLWDQNRRAVRQAGGSVIRLLNDSNGHLGWGSWQQFHAGSAAAAQVAMQLIDRHDRLVVLSGTSAFALVPAMLRQYGPDRRRPLVVHTHGAAIPWAEPGPDPAELTVDSTLATLARVDPLVRVAYVSQFMARVFVDGYGIPPARLLPNLTGVHQRDRRLAPRAAAAGAERLRELGVPTDRRLVLAWGRSSTAGLDKGYDLLIRACHRLGDAVVPVVLTRERDEALQDLCTRLGVPAVLRHGQPFDAVAAVLRWPRTVAAVFAAKDDPGAAGPLEAMRVAERGGAVVVGVRSGSYPDVVQDGRTGLLAERDEHALADRLNDALGLADDDRARLRAAAGAHVSAHHDSFTNTLGLLDQAVRLAVSRA